MIINAQKNGNTLSIEIPLNQYPFKPEKVARYIIALYEFNFIPTHTKCFITAEVDDGRFLFCVKPDLVGNLFERTFHTLLYRVPSAAFINELEESGFEIIETTQMSWEVFKK